MSSILVLQAALLPSLAQQPKGSLSPPAEVSLASFAKAATAPISSAGKPFRRPCPTAAETEMHAVSSPLPSHRSSSKLPRRVREASPRLSPNSNAAQVRDSAPFGQQSEKLIQHICFHDQVTKVYYPWSWVHYCGVSLFCCSHAVARFPIVCFPSQLAVLPAFCLSVCMSVFSPQNSMSLAACLLLSPYSNL